ncbi:hypothetical protein G8764_08955 [Pseudomaricurvus alcaniphilus]|uniref:hypothetical protein n=1 Tax=Pseudomaricurvus alcaniphilus TaxID=1166482 RepID=UPI00140E1642|nr:hypothetical protein [Pseudomaricurvus alcaniphilus]NHN37417.1 hypothetical protein [Pseudomaricurvus alcaniphilus]
MDKGKTFVNRRKGTDRRYDSDPCRDIPLDLYHRKRRKRTERRAERTLVEDYYAFIQASSPSDSSTDNSIDNNPESKQ